MGVAGIARLIVRLVECVPGPLAERQGSAVHRGEALTGERHRAGHAERRLAVEQEADPCGGSGKDGPVPQQHPGDRTAEREEGHLAPRRRREVRQPRTGA